jgi:hypothetical protein
MKHGNIEFVVVKSVACEKRGKSPPFELGIGYQI